MEERKVDEKSSSKAATVTRREEEGAERRRPGPSKARAADLSLAARLHADLADAIAAADPEAAATACDRLIDYVETFTRTTVEVLPAV